MMDENAATVPNFVTILLDYANGSLKRAVDGLTDEQVYHQPTEDTNNIAWLAWHMNRWKDWQGHAGQRRGAGVDPRRLVRQVRHSR